MASTSAPVSAALVRNPSEASARHTPPNPPLRRPRTASRSARLPVSGPMAPPMPVDAAEHDAGCDRGGFAASPGGRRPGAELNGGGRREGRLTGFNPAPTEHVTNQSVNAARRPGRCEPMPLPIGLRVPGRKALAPMPARYRRGSQSKPGHGPRGDRESAPGRRCGRVARQAARAARRSSSAAFPPTRPDTGRRTCRGGR